MVPISGFPRPPVLSTPSKWNRHLSQEPPRKMRSEAILTSFKAVMILDLKMTRAQRRAISQNVSMIPEDWIPFLLSS